MAHDPQDLSRASQAEAVRAFSRCLGLDPQGQATPESAAAAGELFKLCGPGGHVVMSVEFDPGGVAWIHAAAGQGQGMTAQALACVERLAATRNCHAVEFQTLRAGLVRLAERSGYRRAAPIGAGVIMQKAIT